MQGPAPKTAMASRGVIAGALLVTTASGAAAQDTPARLDQTLTDGLSEAGPPAPSAQMISTPDIEDIWITEIRLRRRVVLLADVLAYGDGNGSRLFVGLSDLTAALDFPIAYDAATGQASGWFLRENQRFDFDTRTGKGMVAGQKISLSREQVLVDNGELYLPLDAVSQWLQLGAEWQSTNQIISLNPAYLLPDEEAGRRASQAGGRGKAGPLLDAEALTRVEAPYRVLAWPHAQMNLSATTRGAAGPEVQGNAVLRGDLAMMSGEVFVSGTSAGNTNARLTLSRSDPDAALLGPLQASDLQLGALSLSQAPLIRQSTIGTGLRLARQSSGQGETFAAQLIEGDAAPGWQAELYRGNQLLGFQTIGANGRYLFPDVPLQVGDNLFTVKLYGPQGEQEELERRFEIARTATRPGEFTYLAEVIQPRRPLTLSQDGLFGAQDNNTGTTEDDPFEPRPGQQGLTAQAQLGYGLTDSFSVRALVSWQEISDQKTTGQKTGGDGDLAFAGIGSDFASLGALFSVDGLVSQGGEWAARGGVAFTLGGVSVFAESEQYSDGFVSNANSFNTNTVLSERRDLRLDGTLRVPALDAGLNWGAQYSRSRFRDGRRFETASLRTSTAIKRISIANRINWNRQFDAVGTSSERMIGTASAAGAVGPVRIRAGLDYELTGDPGIRNWSLDAQARVDDFALNLRYQRNERSRSNTVSLGVSRDFAGVRLGVNARYDDFSGSVDALLTLTFALDRNPLSGRARMGRAANSDRGLAIVSAFEDANGNGAFDDDEYALDGFGIIAEPRGRVREDEGRVILSNFAVDRRQAIALDADALEDPFAIPSSAGVAVIARPGAVAKIALPVIQSGEVEYTLRDKAGEGVANSIVELVHCQTGVRYRERSAYDGLVLFQRVPPGCYVLTKADGERVDVQLEAGETLVIEDL